MNDYKEIKIPLSLYRSIEEKIQDGDSISVSDFVTNAARKALSDVSGEQDTISDDEKERIKEKLKSLGYI